jgi:hypothetical protein
MNTTLLLQHLPRTSSSESRQETWCTEGLLYNVLPHHAYACTHCCTTAVLNSVLHSMLYIWLWFKQTLLPPVSNLEPAEGEPHVV